MITIVLAGRVFAVANSAVDGGLELESCHWKGAGVSVSLSKDNGHHAFLPGSACC